MESGLNLDEPIGKTVGPRVKPPAALLLSTSNQQTSIQWRRAFGGVRIPRGVYRFASHEEADEWLWKMITRPQTS